MGHTIVVASVTRHRRAAWETLCRDYRTRASRFVAMSELPVKLRREASDDRSRLRLEGKALESALPPGGLRVGLDRGGRAYDSLELARVLGRWLERASGSLVFLVGSDLGLDRPVLESCTERWSLSPLTLPHELARLVVYEQLYRALSIRAGMSYHRVPLR